MHGRPVRYDVDISTTNTNTSSSAEAEVEEKPRDEERGDGPARDFKRLGRQVAVKPCAVSSCF